MTARSRRWVAAVTGGLVAALAAAPPAVADSFRDRQWHLSVLNVAQAHQMTMGDGVVVAVVDSGVKADHPDLAGNVLPGVDLTGVDTKGQQDTSGHGTAMAGLIAGHGHGPDNADGAIGIAPHAKILPIREHRDLLGTTGGVAAGIDAAVKGGAKVVSVSLAVAPNDALKQAVQTALAADVVVVAGVGNRPKDSFVGYPAAYPGVVAVGATDKDGNLAPVSMTGREVMLTAPGVDIVSTDGIGGYRIGTGTSDSTAIVAGAAALIRAKYPTLPATEVVHRLTATATDKGTPGRDPQYGYGVLNLVAALTADVKPAPTGGGSAPTDGQPSPAAAGPTAEAEGSTPLKLSPAFFVCLGVVGLLVAVGIGLAIWLVVRGRNKPSSAVTGYPASGHSTSPHLPYPQGPGQRQHSAPPPESSS
ncbi:type VII secretion-associated serine protease mycosin [Planosporangium sp. 12N6]|uniref:type VII secretion-associated serine protease mycosin n=1 Tax=Planosporangium spinosum TaxID=3402278 RepID=UPI003CEB86F5